MASSLLFLLVSLSVFLIFTETVTLRVYNTPVFTIIIDLTVFGVALRRAVVDNTSKKKRKKLLSPPSVAIRKQLILSLLKKSKVKLRYLRLPLSADNPLFCAISYAAIFALVSSALTLLKENAKIFSAGNISIGNNDNNILKPVYDLEAEIPLAWLIVSSFGPICNYIKEIIRKNGRKQNERND